MTTNPKYRNGRDRATARSRAFNLGHQLRPFKAAQPNLWIAYCRNGCGRFAVIGGTPMVSGTALDIPCNGAVPHKYFGVVAVTLRRQLSGEWIVTTTKTFSPEDGGGQEDFELPGGRSIDHALRVAEEMSNATLDRFFRRGRNGRKGPA